MKLFIFSLSKKFLTLLIIMTPQLVFLINHAYSQAKNQPHESRPESEINPLISENLKLKGDNLMLKKKAITLQRYNKNLKKINIRLQDRIKNLRSDSVFLVQKLNKEIASNELKMASLNKQIGSLKDDVSILNDSIYKYREIKNELHGVKNIVNELKLAERTYSCPLDITFNRVKNYLLYNQSKYELSEATSYRIFLRESIKVAIPRRIIGNKKIIYNINYLITFRIHPVSNVKTLMDVRMDTIDSSNKSEHYYLDNVKLERNLLKKIDLLLLE